jgi:5-dehydro-2-deoxygluconokinase
MPPSTSTLDVLAMGRSCIDLYAHEVGVPITEVKSFDAYIGGCALNVSVGTRRLGLRSGLLTAVGEDQVGDFVLASLQREGVDTRFIPRKPGRRTSAVILTIQPPDRFPLTFYRDNCADRAMDLDDVRAAPVAQSRLVFLTGTGLSHQPGRAATELAARTAREAGVDLLVDLDYRPDQWETPRAYAEAVRALVSYATLAVGTEEEVRAAGEDEDVDRAAARLTGDCLEAVIIKRGGDGAAVRYPGGTRVEVPPVPITVLNVLGAGDAFASGFIHGRLQGWPLERAARFGNGAGAIVVTRHGCANFMPTREEVEAILG